MRRIIKYLLWPLTIIAAINGAGAIWYSIAHAAECVPCAITTIAFGIFLLALAALCAAYLTKYD